MRTFRHRSWLATLLLCTSSAWATVTPNGLFKDHAVLQRGVELPIWGTASPGEQVTVEMNGQIAKATTSGDGGWSVKLPPMAAGGPFTMTIRGSNSVTVRDLLVGEVWLCSGQSNMEWRLSGREPWAGDGLPAQAAQYPMIREYAVARDTDYAPVTQVGGQWSVCSPESVLGFSGVAYFFARDLHADLGVPIGIIVSAWGGTVAEAWTSATGLKTLPDFQEAVAEVERKAEREKSAPPIGKQMAAWYGANDPGSKPDQSWSAASLDVSDWHPTPVPAMWKGSLAHYEGSVWYRKEIELPPAFAERPSILHMGRLDETDTVWVNGQQVGSTMGWNLDRNYRVPTGLLKAGKNTIAIRLMNTDGPGGFEGSPDAFGIETEGESPSSVSMSGTWLFKVGASINHSSPLPIAMGSRPNVPTVLYNGMIAPLRPFPIKGIIWYQGESNQDRAKQYESLFPTLIEDWRRNWKQPNLPFLFVQIAPFKGIRPQIREAQRITLSKTRNTAMAVITDAGDPMDIHPRNKQPPGSRLALAARALAYGETLEYSGPLYKSVQFDGDRAILRFTHVGDGMVVKGKTLRGFVIAGEDKKFVAAKAEVIGDTVVVRADGVNTPVAVRYGWAKVPDVNLYNTAGLPASPFKTDPD
ncbi:MAG: sialate O-acetylesterase [Tepidisphaeraceae bacterium]